jgi:hypothetical protein
MVINTEPLIVVFVFGSIRISLEEFDLNNEDMSIHITNVSASKMKPNFKEM